MEASPAVVPMNRDCTPEKLSLHFGFARARVFLSKRKNQFFWCALHFGAERRGCLLFILAQSVKSPPELKNIGHSFSSHLRYLIVIIVINMRHDTQESYV